MDHRTAEAEELITCKWCSVPKSPEDYFPSFLKTGYHVCREYSLARQEENRRTKGVQPLRRTEGPDPETGLITCTWCSVPKPDYAEFYQVVG